MTIPSPERIAHAQTLYPGLRVEVEGKPGQIIAPGHALNRFNYHPIFLIRLDGQVYEGVLPVWSDEIEVAA